MFFFFKQKTAYEMRISDWSSDVCSSDLLTAVQKLYRHLHAIVYIDLLPRLRGIVDRLVGEAALRHELDLDGAAHRAAGRRMPFIAPVAIFEPDIVGRKLEHGAGLGAGCHEIGAGIITDIETREIARL